MTVFFIFIIVICTLCTLLLNSVNAKLGRVESSQKEFTLQLKKLFDMKQQSESSEDLSVSEKAAESARQSYIVAMEAYNQSISSFPGVLISHIFGFKVITDEEENNFH